MDVKQLSLSGPCKLYLIIFGAKNLAQFLDFIVITEMGR